MPLPRLAVFYHCWWRRDAARNIMLEQMKTLKQCGLEDEASEIHIGFQGTPEGFAEVRNKVAPSKSSVHMLEEILGETPTLKLIHAWVPQHPEWRVCYFHAKGSSHGDAPHRWRRCMERAVLWNWRQCVDALQSVDSAGAHWMCNVHGQWFWGGNFWWCTASYLSQLPPPRESSRWDAEIWVSNVTKMPKIKDVMSNHRLGECP